jgi:hypothetical protein
MELIRNPRMIARFRLALDLSEAGILMMKQNLYRRHPEATEAEISSRLAAWVEKRPYVDPRASQDS